MSAPIPAERRAVRPLWTVLQDERGTWSASRVLLVGWLANAALYIWWRPNSESLGLVLTFFSAIAVPLVVWAAGPRIAQYLGPAVGGVVQGVAESAKALAAKVQARRNAADGYEVTK